MVDSTQIISDFQSVVDDIGQPISITRFSTTHDDSDYDDVVTASGTATTVWTSGIIQPISFRGGANNSHQNVLLEQGLIKLSDKILYIASGTEIQDKTNQLVQIGIGSPNRDTFSILSDGLQVPTEVDGAYVYQKVFIRRITTGSIID